MADGILKVINAENETKEIDRIKRLSCRDKLLLKETSKRRKAKTSDNIRIKRVKFSSYAC